MLRKLTAQSEGLDLQACREVVASVFKKFHQSDLENLIWSCEGMASRARDWDADYLDRILDGVDVRIVFFARYVDDWVESLIKERIRGRSKSAAERLSKKPLPSPGPRSGAEEAAATGRRGSMLEKGAKFIDALRMMRAKLPSAEIVVRSFDANRAEGKVVSGALAAMGVPVEGAFPDADDEAETRNATKSDLFSMLLYHLIVAGAGVDVLRAVGAAARNRDRRGRTFEPLAGRRFRFLSDEDVMQARGYYEELRQEYPQLPAQPPHVSRPAERYLPKEEGIAVLDWLRPDISDAVFDQACAAYPADPRG
ncbi:MAG: hypothetical protein H0X27_10880 [Caulobacteraceae bacterium]|nr:hypothetical protein [Caulobacteraceae bacterium]